MDSISHSEDILQRVREIVARVKEVDLSEFLSDQQLELDSINRIALIAEIENQFGLELGDDDVLPEVFDSLASLSTMIEAKLA